MIFAQYCNQNHKHNHVSSSLERGLSELSNDTLLEKIKR